MAKKIIILGANASSVSQTIVNAIFWYPITSGAQPQTSGSVWANASAAENAAIQNGTVLEEQQSFSFPTGMTLAQSETELGLVWTNRQAQINGRGPALFTGVFLDSLTGWSQ